MASTLGWFIEPNTFLKSMYVCKGSYDGLDLVSIVSHSVEAFLTVV